MSQFSRLSADREKFVGRRKHESVIEFLEIDEIGFAGKHGNLFPVNPDQAGVGYDIDTAVGILEYVSYILAYEIARGLEKFMRLQIPVDAVKSYP